MSSIGEIIALTIDVKLVVCVRNPVMSLSFEGKFIESFPKSLILSLFIKFLGPDVK